MNGHLEWDDLRTFLLIARHHTLSGAARELGVQQPTMGRRLEALEQRLGARLLQRTPQGYVLTPAGEAVFASVERIEAEALTVERLIAGKDVRLEGVVRFTTVDTIASEVLPPILTEFGRKHPGVTVDILATKRSLSLARREADVALRPHPFTQQELVASKVGAVAYGIYASPSYVEHFGTPSWGSGRSHAVVLTGSEHLDTPDIQWFRSLLPEASTAYVTNSRLLHRGIAQDGAALACLPRYMADNAPGLVRLDPPDPSPLRELWLAVHSDLRRTPRIRAFTTALQEGLRHAARRLNPNQ